MLQRYSHGRVLSSNVAKTSLFEDNHQSLVACEFRILGSVEKSEAIVLSYKIRHEDYGATPGTICTPASGSQLLTTAADESTVSHYQTVGE